MSGRRNQGYGPGFIKPQAPQAPPDPMVIYKNLLSLLRSVSRTMNLGLDATLAQYYTAMCSPQAVTRIIRSSQCRKPLLDTAARLGLTNDPRLREALRMDEERLLATLPLVIHSQAPLPQGLTDDDAQHLLDVLQNMLRKTLSQENRLETRRMLRRVSEASNKLPSSMFITGVTDCDAEPSFGGGYADVFRASLKGKAVALKRLREYVYGQNAAAVRLKFCQEALIWQSLNHPHILRLLGIDRETFSPSLCMVLPWMGQGQIETHLRANGRQHVQKLLWEVAQGLEYLHLQNVVHGDLKGDNILVTGKWTACLTDFGLSKFSDLSGRRPTKGGNVRWMAPELIAPDDFGLLFARTTQSDVYAFGCVCVELYTGRLPFSDVSADTAVMQRVVAGDRPARPTGWPAMSDSMWHRVNTYWAQLPQNRPNAQAVVQHMRSG